MDYLMSRLGDLLTILVTLDCLVNSSPLSSHWNCYRKSVRELSHSSNTMNRQINKLDSILDLIEDKIMTDKIYENCVDLISHSEQIVTAGKAKSPIEEDISSYVKTKIIELDKSGMDFYESESVIVWIKVNALFILHNSLFGNVDKKIFKMLVDVNIKV